MEMGPESAAFTADQEFPWHLYVVSLSLFSAKEIPCAIAVQISSICFSLFRDRSDPPADWAILSSGFLYGIFIGSPSPLCAPRKKNGARLETAVRSV